MQTSVLPSVNVLLMVSVLCFDLIGFECDGIRSLTVVNKKQRFNPPALLLYQYLEWKSGNQRNM